MEKTPPGFSTRAIRAASRACCSGLNVFNPNVEMTKSALSGRQIACQHVILDEFDLVGTVGVKPLHGAAMHAGGDIDGGD